MRHTDFFRLPGLLLLLLLAGCRESPRSPSAMATQEPRTPAMETVSTDELPAGAGLAVIQEGELRRNESLERLCRRLELDHETTRRLCRSISDVHDPRRLRSGQRWQVLEDSAGERWLALFDGQLRRLRLACNSDSAVVDSLHPTSRLRAAGGVIQSSLYEALIAAGGDPATVLRFAEIFQWDVDFLMDVRQGDRFSLVWEQEVYRGGWLQDSLSLSGRILAAEYEGLNGLKRAVWWQGEGAGGYFDGQGQSLQKRFLKSPLNYSRISSRFGNRFHPILKRVKLHAGVDFAAPRGTPVVASADGVVRSASWLKGLGRAVRLRHGDRYQTVYGHLQGYAKGIKSGARVSQNQVIGYVGSSGLASGPHLHYEVHDRGRQIDPMQLKNSAVSPVPEVELEAFRFHFETCFPATVLAEGP